MIGQLVKIVKPVAEHVARNSGKYLVALGAALEAAVVGATAYFKGKDKGRKEGCNDASKKYEKKFREQAKRMDDIEEQLNK